MIPILYERNETAFVSNGLGRLRDCVSCLVTEERNGIYECDFEYPVTGAHYDEIQLGRIIGVTHDDNGDIQPFDIVGYHKTIEGIVEFHCVHISYRQSYMVASGKNINTLSGALALLKTASPKNPFSYTTNKTVSAYFGAGDGIPRTVRQMLGGVEGSILDAYGGEYEWDKWTVRLWKARGKKRDFTVRYGVNMTDFSSEVDCQETYNACIPFWTSEEKTVIGNKVKSTDQSYNGRELCVPLDLSDKFETAPTKTQLQNMGKQYMASEHTATPVQTIEVSFVRLQDSAEYANFRPLLACNLCDTITVVFPDYQMEEEFKIVKTVWNVLFERYESMELGSLSASLSEALGLSESTGSGGGTKVQHGRITAGNVSSNTWKDFEVTFAEPFASAPHVICGLNSASTGYGLGSVSVSAHDVTVNGFTARMFNNDSATRSPNIEWIAVL